MSYTVIHIPADVDALRYNEALRQVRERSGVREINDRAARAIAMAWQSSGTIGSVLAALASGAYVTVADLHDDIARTRQDAMLNLASDDSAALDALATWAMNGSGD